MSKKATSARAILSYESSPVIAVPMIFFLTAPIFGVLAGLLLASEPTLLVSRWTPGALAATHLLTIGFMLSTMLGALQQILPVVAGACFSAQRITAALLLMGLSVGTLLLCWGLGRLSPLALYWGSIVLAASMLLFFTTVLIALKKSPQLQATPRDLRLGLLALAIALFLGLLLAVSRYGNTLLPFAREILLRLHIGWILLGGGAIVLAASSWVIVPMFQITPPYPQLMTRWWVRIVLLTLFCWSLLAALEYALAESLLLLALLATMSLFPLITLNLQARSRRAKPDVMFVTFRLGMYCLLGGLLLYLPIRYYNNSPDFLPPLLGILVLYGGFISAMQAMLYKIVPFLSWLHLTQQGILAPNVKRLLPEAQIRPQLGIHTLSLGLIMIAVIVGRSWLIRLAGVLVSIDFAFLAINIFSTLLRYYRCLRNPQARETRESRQAAHKHASDPVTDARIS